MTEDPGAAALTEGVAVGHRAAARTIAASVLATVVAALPVFLVGGLSVQIGRELGFGSAGLGLAITSSFSASALASLPAGRVAERLGARTTMTAGVLIAAVSLMSVAAFAHSVLSLAAMLALGGTGNALAQIGANLSLARGVPAGRLGLAFGIKQAAVPIATLFAGLAVPAIALTVGWRWAFILGAGSAVAALATLPPDRGYYVVTQRPAEGMAESASPAGPATPDLPALPDRTRTAPLVVIAAGGVLAAGAAGALGGFLVAWAVEIGVAPGTAGLLMALGSVLGICGRLVDGLLADRRSGGHLVVVAGQLLAGAVGMLLASGAPVGLVLGTVLGYGLGWSWPGLLNFAVVRLNRAAPARATSITQTGIYLGAGAGPLMFGLTATHASFEVAWLGAGAAMVGAAALMVTARRMIKRDRRGGT